MNKLTKIGLTALASSLIATSAFAASMSVTGGADISMVNESNADNGNSFSSGDSLNFSASGELDNGMVITSNVEIDAGNYDDRSVVIAFPEMGTLKFQTSGDTAMSAVDDVMPTAYDASWDVLGSTTTATATGQALKSAPIGGFSQNNNFFYTAPELMEGLAVNLSYTPSNKGTNATTARPDGSVSYALAYTGVEGLTIGYATDDNGKKGTSKIENETMYAKYAFGSFTVGVQSSEADGGSTDDDDEFSAHGITYQLTDDLTIGYHASEYQFGDKSADQETKSVQAAYTMGGMTLGVAMNDHENAAYTQNQDVKDTVFTVEMAF